MFNFAKRQEEVEFKGFPIYVGLAKVTPIAVNPSLEELKELGFNYNEEPKYIGEDFNKQPQTRITLYLKNEEFDFSFPFTVNVSTRKIKSNEGSKLKVINAYGQTAYVTSDQYKELIAGKNTIDNMSHFLPDGVKACYEGEEELLELIRNFRYIPMVNDKTDKANLSDLKTQFTDEQWNMIVSLNKEAISSLKELFLEKDTDGSSFTFGVLLGARTKDNGYLAQDVYRKTVKNYIVNNFDKEKSTGWLVKEVASAQSNNHKSNTNFSLGNLKLREFVEGEDAVKATNKDDMFGDTSSSVVDDPFAGDDFADDFPL